MFYSEARFDLLSQLFTPFEKFLILSQEKAFYFIYLFIYLFILDNQFNKVTIC